MNWGSLKEKSFPIINLSLTSEERSAVHISAKILFVGNISYELGID